MQNKRGQVTIFIILAIVVIGAIVLYFTFGDNLKNIRSPETNEINSFVENCIKGTGRDAIYQISQNGGYYLPTEISTSDGIPYYFYNTENLMPTIKEVEKQLALYINSNLEYCTADFEDLPQYDITAREVTSKVEISDGEITIDVKYPLSITKTDKTYLLENFENIRTPIRLNIIYESIEELIK